ncbi:MAG: permease-like cell division protein FtsX [Muribaculaceae bacterium]|nr:permease-like cell division protein FtsX [Muribaculaceae bacterium]
MKPKKLNKVSALGSQITAIISVAMVLVIVGLLAMSLAASHTVSSEIRAQMGFVIKMDPTAPDSEINRVRAKVAGHPAIASFTFASASQILDEESKLMGEDITALLQTNPFGAEFDIKMNADYANSDSIQALCASMLLDPAIDDIVTQTAVVDAISNTLRRLSFVLLGIAVALLVISFVLINNTVSLAVYSRRFIIHTMKLVGATGAFIRRPFILAGLGTGAVAAVVAAALLAGMRSYAAGFDPAVSALLPWSLMCLIFAGLLVVGLIICALAACVATNRYLRADYDDMFR